MTFARLIYESSGSDIPVGWYGHAMQRKTEAYCAKNAATGGYLSSVEVQAGALCGRVLALHHCLATLMLMEIFLWRRMKVSVCRCFVYRLATKAQKSRLERLARHDEDAFLGHMGMLYDRKGLGVAVSSITKTLSDRFHLLHSCLPIS